MNRLKILSIVLTLCVFGGAARAGDHVYEGQWRTTNRKLDGTMTCYVTDLGGQQWQGRFVGVWQGVPFDYTVKFTGPPDQLQGTATIDGASYTWTGEMSADSAGSFKAKFGGDRYAGYFDLKERTTTLRPLSP
jgi:hypothetical protein